MKRLFLIAAMLCVAGGVLAAEAPKKTAKPTPAPVKDSAMQQIDQFIASAKVDKTKPDWKTHLPKPPVATFDKAHKYYARMVTNKGPILIQFMPGVAPMHVTNFVYLSKLGFYNGTKFHRVIPGFMAQGGDPLGNGTGGPGYGFGGEFSPNVKHDQPGRLSMANTGQPDSDGSQFFLTFKPTPWLDGKHTVFGEVIEGMDTLKKLEAAGSANQGVPTEPLTLEKVTIEVK
ncbi:MAG TPA: peptidylprolyl isomerase [Terriglobales bacterium]|nr:peptidylprolyl isomerase [Terriglobales bacterium]